MQETVVLQPTQETYRLITGGQPANIFVISRIYPSWPRRQVEVKSTGQVGDVLSFYALSSNAWGRCPPCSLLSLRLGTTGGEWGVGSELAPVEGSQGSVPWGRLAFGALRVKFEFGEPARSNLDPIRVVPMRPCKPSKGKFPPRKAKRAHRSCALGDVRFCLLGHLPPGGPGAGSGRAFSIGHRLFWPFSVRIRSIFSFYFGLKHS